MMMNKQMSSGQTGFPMRIILIVVGSLLILDTLVVMTLSNFNLGVILPAFFGVPLLIMGIALPWSGQGFWKFVKIAEIAAYSLAGLIFLVCGVLMIRANKSPDTVERKTVIVLGAAVHGDRVTWVLSNRLDTAADYLEKHPDAVAVVSGGMGNGETVTEAEAMKRYLVERKGVSEERILTEDQATSTEENFRYSAALLEREGMDTDSIAFVTTNFHVFRAGRVAKKIGIDAPGIGAPDVWYIAVNNFMRECVGICVYALTGRL